MPSSYSGAICATANSTAASRQHEVDRFDFVCTEAMLIVDLDGGQHTEQAAHDNRRTQCLQAIGYRVLRFWNNAVLTKIESVPEVIFEPPGKPGPSPQPSPRRGERGARKMDFPTKLK